MENSREFDITWKKHYQCGNKSRRIYLSDFTYIEHMPIKVAAKFPLWCLSRMPLMLDSIISQQKIKQRCVHSRGRKFNCLLNIKLISYDFSLKHFNALSWDISQHFQLLAHSISNRIIMQFRICGVKNISWILSTFLNLTFKR